MNTPASAVLESGGQSSARLEKSPATRLLYWSLRRELWENRSLYLAPAGIAALFILGFLISIAHLPTHMRQMAALDPAEFHQTIVMPYDFAAGLMMLTSILLSIFYSADALYGERRDRSILFWKSLPVSDTTTVLAKVSVPLVVVPLVTFLASVIMQFIMAVGSSAVLLASGISVAPLWTELSLGRMWLLLLYHFFLAHAIWPLPIYCWLLVVSGWARRAVLLWAALPIIAIAGVERLAFHTGHFARLVAGRLIGNAPIFSSPGDSFPTSHATHITPLQFLGAPGLGIGLAVSAAFVIVAIRLRRSQAPI